MLRATLLIAAAALVCVTARPKIYHEPAVLPLVVGSPSTAQGTAGSTLTSSKTELPGGGSTNVVQQGANTGGQAMGGGINTGTASSKTQSLLTPQGTTTSSDTGAQSTQGSLPGFQGFPAGVQPVSQQGLNAGLYPVGQQGTHAKIAVPVIPGFPTPQAAGTSSGQITQSETLNPSGGTTNVIQQGASTGGSASGGGVNFGKASTGSQSQQTQFGTSSSSDTDAVSTQSGGPVFTGGFPGAFPGGFPAGLQYPGQGGCNPGLGTAPLIQGPGIPQSQGTAGGQITKSETTLPGGGSTNVVQQGASAGGSASGGGFSDSQASTGSQSLSTLEGTSTSSNTEAKSVQGANPIFTGGFPAGLQYPGQGGCNPNFGTAPLILGPGIPQSQGTAGGQITESQTTLPGGGSTNVVQQGASAGGSASGGGVSVGKASTGSQSQQTQFGTSSTSDANAQSTQTSGPVFTGFPAGAGFPHHQSQTIFGPGQYQHQQLPNANFPQLPVFPGLGYDPRSQGTASGQLVNTETFNPFGGSEKVSRLTSGTGGQASGGGISTGSSSGDTQSLLTPHGKSTSSDTSAQSIQGANPGLHQGFGWQPFPGLHGTAAGTAQSGLTDAVTTGADGSRTTVTQLGSSAGGSASGGGTNVSKSSGKTATLTGAGGTQTQSHVDSQSTQTSR